MTSQKKVKALIVEDEQRSIATLKKLLEDHCPQVEILDAATSVSQAIDKIKSLKPELVFLDIALPDGDGFEVLEKLDKKSFKVIFTTAYDKYAIRAFEFSALHYLLKPINKIDLQQAVDRYFEMPDQEEYDKKLEVLNRNLKGNSHKIIVSTSEGLIIVDSKEILRCEASHNYTYCYLKDNRKLLVSKTLANFEDILTDLNFVRVHNKHLVNLKYVKRYVKGQGGYVIMSDKAEISVSKLKKNEFLHQLQQFAKFV